MGAQLGAGKGCYADTLRRSPRRRAGATVRAFDGAPNVGALTGGLVERADLTAPLMQPPAEWVLCLETAEHIPRTHEAQLLANMHGLNTKGIVLSWSNNAGGNGHVNLRTNPWVEVGARSGPPTHPPPCHPPPNLPPPILPPPILPPPIRILGSALGASRLSSLPHSPSLSCTRELGSHRRSAGSVRWATTTISRPSARCVRQ